jgi:hypothetical protein
MSAQDLMEELNVSLSDAQAKKLMKGGTIQLSPAQFAGPGKLLMDKKKAKKLMRAVQKGKGMRVSLSPSEIETIQGAGLWDLIKKGAQWIKDSGVLRPILKAGAKTLIPLAAGVFGGPAGAAAATAATQKYADDVVDKAGDVLGFGMKGGALKGGMVKGKGMKGGAMKGRKKAPKRVAPRPALAKAIPQLSNNSNFITPVSASSNPPMAQVPDQSIARVFPRGVSKTGTQIIEGAGMRGGSFKPAGY